MPRYRNRWKYYSGQVDWYYKYSNPPTGQDIVTKSVEDRCWDDVGIPPYDVAHTLRLLQVKGKPGRVHYASYKHSNDSYGTIRRIPLVPSTDYVDVWTFPENDWITEALAKTQDMSPIVDIPLNIAELKDIPRTLRSIFSREISLGRARDVYLTQQFGINPIVSETMKLLSLQRSIAERMRRHRRKFRTQRSRGSLSKGAAYDWTSYHVSQIGTYIPRWGQTWRASTSRKPSSEQWFSARIEPQYSLPEILGQAASNPTGIGEASLQTIWNLIPWSFLVDYFTNVGDVLGVIGNRMPYRVTRLCVMCTAKLEVTVTPWNETFRITYSNLRNGKVKYYEKRRFVYGNPTPAFNFSPLLSGQQIANLAVLATGLRGR